MCQQGPAKGTGELPRATDIKMRYFGRGSGERREKLGLGCWAVFGVGQQDGEDANEERKDEEKLRIVSTVQKLRKRTWTTRRELQHCKKKTSKPHGSLLDIFVSNKITR